MRLISIILILVVSLAISGCGGKYSNIKVDSEDVQGYVNAYTIFDANFKDFLIAVNTGKSLDTNAIKDYQDIMYILNSQGFPDVEYFQHIHSKLYPVVEVIARNSKVERFPGIGIADLSFLEEGEKQYRKFLEDSTLSNNDKEFYRAQMAQIETTKVDLFDKQEKNKLWVALIRKEADTDVDLSDIDIMQLTILEREITKL